MGKRVQLAGRIVPILGFGYVMHNIVTGNSGPENRKGEGFWQGAVIYGAQDAANYYGSGGSTVGLMTGGKETPSSIVERFF